jgi:hypothetical protein
MNFCVTSLLKWTKVWNKWLVNLSTEWNLSFFWPFLLYKRAEKWVILSRKFFKQGKISKWNFVGKKLSIFIAFCKYSTFIKIILKNPNKPKSPKIQSHKRFTIMLRSQIQRSKQKVSKINNMVSNCRPQLIIHYFYPPCSPNWNPLFKIL